MSGLFLRVLDMSLSASWLVLAVLLFRVLWRKTPRWVYVLLWGYGGNSPDVPVRAGKRLVFDAAGGCTQSFLGAVVGG